MIVSVVYQKDDTKYIWTLDLIPDEGIQIDPTMIMAGWIRAIAPLEGMEIKMRLRTQCK